MPNLKDNSISPDIIALKESNSNCNIDKLLNIFSLNNNQKSESTTSSSNLKAVCSSNHESQLSFESSVSFSKEKTKPQVSKQQQQQQQQFQLQNQSIRISDNLLTFSPVTPIVDSSEPISDCSENIQSPEDKAQTATYKSIMIIDVFDKFYSTTSLTSNQFSHQQHEQTTSQQQKSNMIIKNLNETISPTKVNIISNAINKHFNNFYLLNMSNNIIENESSSYDEKKSSDNIANNVFVYKNSIRLGELSEKMNALGIKSDQDHERTENDRKRCLLLRNKHSNRVLDYVSDERKIFSYDLTQLQDEDKNVMKKTFSSLTTVANNQKNSSNVNLNKRKNLSEILNDLENSLRSSISINQFTLDCLNDDLSETNSIIELQQNDEDDIFNTINSSDSIKNNMYLINSHLTCSLSDTTSNSTASSSKSSCHSNSACSSQSNSSLSGSSSRCSSRCSNGTNSCNEKANEAILFFKDDNLSKSNQQSCRSSPTFLLINDFEKSTTGIDHSAEFARADDVISVMNSNGQNNNHETYQLNHNKSSDDEFTYSELNCLSNYEDDMPRLLKIEKLTEEEEEAEEEENGDEENEVADEIDKERELEENSPFEILNVNVHRLPGELLGMNLRVEENGSVVVMNIIQNSAADRSSDSNGNRCPIRCKDEITEINGVSLSNMSNEEILTVVQELPLFVSLTIKRRSSSSSPIPSMLTPTDATSKSNIKQKENSKLAILSPNSTNLNIPPGYTLHNIYLSSMESKCIMPCDLKECNEVEGLYKIQRNTLQIGEEDHLKKGDILYTINDLKLEYKNKFDLISKLSSVDGIAEVCVLRKLNPPNCYPMMTHNVDENCNMNVPYHNGIFAQNSIKLTMRKYDKPSCKSNSDLDFQQLPEPISSHANRVKTPTAQSPSQTLKLETNTIVEESEKLDNREEEKHTNGKEVIEEAQHIQADFEVFKNENQDENLKNEDFMSCLNGQVLTSMHSDNWLLFYDRKTSHNQLNNMNSAITATTTTRTTHNSVSLEENTHFVKSQEYSLSQFYEKDTNQRAAHIDDADDDLQTIDCNNFSATHEKTTQSITTATGFMPTLESEQDKQDGGPKVPFSFNIEDATMRSLTNSSCHSERSCVHLNCAFCGDEDENHDHVKEELDQIEKEALDEQEQDKQAVDLYDVNQDNTNKIFENMSDMNEKNGPCQFKQDETILAKPSEIRIATDIPSSSNSSISNKFVSTFQFQLNKDQNKKYKRQITFIKGEPDEHNTQENQTCHQNVEIDSQENVIINDGEIEDGQKDASSEIVKERVEQQELQEQIQENDSYLSETITSFNQANRTMNNMQSNDYYYCNKINLNTSNDLTCSLFNATNNEMENSMTQNEERIREVQLVLNELLSEIECKHNRAGPIHFQHPLDREYEEKIEERQVDNSGIISSIINEILEQVERDLLVKSSLKANQKEISEPSNSKSFADLKKMMHQELVHVMKSAKSPNSTAKTIEQLPVEEAKISRNKMDTLVRNKNAHYESFISSDNNFDPLNSSIQHNLHCPTVTTTVSFLADSTVSQFKFPSINNFNTLTKCLESVIELKKEQQQQQNNQDVIEQEGMDKNEIVRLSFIPPPPPPPPFPFNGESMFKPLNKKSFSKSIETLSVRNSDNELKNYSKASQNSKTINHEHKREFLKELQEKQQLIASFDLPSKFKLNTRFRNRKESSKINLTERFSTLIPAARSYDTLKATSSLVDSSEQKQHFSSKTLTLSSAKNRLANKPKTRVRFSTLPNGNSNSSSTDSPNKNVNSICVGERVEVKVETKPDSNGVGSDLIDQSKLPSVLKSEDHSNEESTSIDYVESAFDKQIKQRPFLNAQIKFQHPARLPLPNNNKSNQNDLSQENKQNVMHLMSPHELMSVKDKIRLFTSASTSNTNNASKATGSTQNINSSFNDLTCMKPISIRKANRLADSLPSIYPFQIASSFVSSSTSDSSSGSMVHMNCAPSLLSTTTASFVNKFNANTNLKDFSARCLSTQTLSTNCHTQNSSSSTTTFLNLKAESCNQLNNHRGIYKKNQEKTEKGTIIYSNYSNKTTNDDSCDHQKEKTFKSIKEKIAFFSSQANKEKETSSISYSVPSQRNINTPNKLANRIEIVELNNNQVRSNSYEYDSLRYAYKLNQLTTFTTKSAGDTASLNKAANTSSIRLLTNDSSVKSILFDSNENKISELIANMETRIKQL